MSIEVHCTCGQSFRAKDEHAGFKAKCPNCGSVIQIPKAIHKSSPTPNELSLNDLREGLEEDLVGTRREASLTDLWKVLNAILAKLDSQSSIALSSTVASSTNDRLREYKVITQKDKWFSGKFDPEKVEGILNSYAKQGWSFKGVATASIPGFGGQREEIVIILER